MSEVNKWGIKIAIVTFLCAGGYFLLSPSYNAARNARAFYEARDYEKALILANEIYAKNPYNVMAYSVAKQSEKAIKRKRFLDDITSYVKRMRILLAQSRLERADLIEINMMIEAAEYDRSRLGESATIWDQNLVRESDERYGEFRDLCERFLKTTKR
ncbi:MAG: hypothetical protein LBU73_09235 [Helicobacteraceae bacterium]|jgi:tetratricopeptide (TPR) repeat protein|nr:hypothetical protein [Helicobacteraceae bacterium]